jgi:hypothetical protein
MGMRKGKRREGTGTSRHSRAADALDQGEPQLQQVKEGQGRAQVSQRVHQAALSREMG